jgi:hypothetical protein
VITAIDPCGVGRVRPTSCREGGNYVCDGPWIRSVRASSRAPQRLVLPRCGFRHESAVFSGSPIARNQARDSHRVAADIVLY